MWSRGNKLWTFSFRSLNNTLCRVNIYKRGYTGDVVLSLTPAANPFYYEEDNDDDLLNNTVRYKTGYIRLIEWSAEMSLSNLYPTSDDEHYVEFYYGNRLDFVGFMQTQSFSNSYAPYPREVEFPIASPLWLLANRKFNRIPFWAVGDVNKPRNITLGSLLDEILSDATINGIYSHIMFPYWSDMKLQNKIYSLVVCPWNDDFNHIVQSEVYNPIYESETYEYFLDAICKAFGWVLHDDVDCLTFSMFDYKQKYGKYPVGHIGDTSYLDETTGEDGGTAVELSNSLTYCDDNATENMLLPYSRIKMEFDGNIELSASPNFKRTFFLNTASWEDSFWCCFLNRATDELPTATGGEFDSVGRFDAEGIHIIAFYTWQNTDVREGIAYALRSNQRQGDTLFTLRLYTKLTNLPWRVQYSIESGLNLNSMDSSDTTHRYQSINVGIYRGTDYVDFTFTVTSLGSGWTARDVMFFSDIRFYAEGVDQFEEYSTIVKEYELFEGGNPTYQDGSVTLPISMYRNNDHQIDSTIRATKFTEYAYLLNIRNELQARFKVNTPIDHPWCKLWKYISNSWRWRMIGYSFEPWNDEMTVTIERSTTLNS